MGFLVDTSIWIAVERGKLAVGDLHAITKQFPVFVSPVNIAELTFGIALMDDVSKQLKAKSLVKRLSKKPLLKITAETGEVFGTIAAQLSRAGRGADFRVQDLWLAAQAIQRRFVLLTLNGKDFRDIPGLKFVIVRLPN